MTSAPEGSRLRIYRESSEPEQAFSLKSFWHQVRPHSLPLMIVACVLLGIGLRSVCYWRNQSLWIDESMLALNVIHRPSAQLLEPLDLNQGAPVGYLLASKFVIQCLGPSELGLRAISYASGLAGLLMFLPLAYQLLPLSAARFAIMGYALSPYLVGYCAEFKQYELDATLTVLLLWVSSSALWQPTAWRAIRAAVVGGLCLWFSHPALFTLTAIGLVLLADALLLRDRRLFVQRSLLALVWAVSFLLCYSLFLRKLGLNDYLLTYWNGTFLPMPPVSLGNLAWVVHHLLQFYEQPGGFGTPEFALSGLAAFTATCGAIHLGQRQWRLLAVLIGPLLLALIASGLKKYPFTGRMLLFAVPLGLLLVSIGAAHLHRLINQKLLGAGSLLMALLFLAPIVLCKGLLQKPLHAEQTREMLAQIYEQWQPGDQLYVYSGAVPSLAYYYPRFPLPPDSVILGQDYRNGPLAGLLDDLDRARGSGRLWVLIAHRKPSEEAAIRAYLLGSGVEELHLSGHDATLICSAPRPPMSIVRAGN